MELVLCLLYNDVDCGGTTALLEETVDDEGETRPRDHDYDGHKVDRNKRREEEVPFEGEEGDEDEDACDQERVDHELVPSRNCDGDVDELYEITTHGITGVPKEDLPMMRRARKVVVTILEKESSW